MKQPSNRNQNSSSTRTQIIIVSVLLGIGIIVLLALIGFLFLQGRSPLSIPATLTPPIPTIIVPTVDCGEPTLALGSSIFPIQTLTHAADGSLTVPPDTSGIAYWVEGTNKNYVFVFSPTQENLSFVSALNAGSTAKATWQNCNSTTYALSGSQPGSFNGSSLPDQSVEGITIFFPTDATGTGFVLNGGLTEEQISTFDTPAPGTFDLQAEISLLEATPSEDGTTLKVSVSIQNYGAVPITLSSTDVTLLQEDSNPVAMAGSEPALPKEIAPGVTETISLTFQRPNSPESTLRIFTVEYDLEGY